MKLIITALAAILTGCSSITGTPVAEPPPVISMEERAASFVRSHVQQSMDTDEVFSPLKLKITDVLVVHAHGNFYKGMVTVQTFAGTSRDIAVGITADGERFILETERGVLAWTLEDGYPPGTVDRPGFVPTFDGWALIKNDIAKCSMTADFVQCAVPFNPPVYSDGVLVNGATMYADGHHTWSLGSIDGDADSISNGYYRALTWTFQSTGGGIEFTHDNGTTFFVDTSGVTAG